MTNKGLNIHILILDQSRMQSNGIESNGAWVPQNRAFPTLLNCSGESRNLPLIIYLKQDTGVDHCRRWNPNKITVYDPNKDAMRGKRRFIINDYLISSPLDVVNVEQDNVSWSASSPISVTLSILQAKQRRFFIAYRYMKYEPLFEVDLAMSYREAEPGDPTLSFQLRSADVAGWFFSQEATSSKFVLILENFGSRIGTRIFTSPRIDAPNYLTRTVNECIPHDSPDRVSEHLNSGQSVSVVIRRVFEDGKVKNLVDITFRDDGVLEWPSLESQESPEESGERFPIRNAERY